MGEGYQWMMDLPFGLVLLGGALFFAFKVWPWFVSIQERLITTIERFTTVLERLERKQDTMAVKQDTMANDIDKIKNNMQNRGPM